jgi:F420H(2)-dependent quinone reductase
MLITFTGRQSGRTFTTPVRYLRSGPNIHCFTSAENKWWRNLRGGAQVCVLVRGERMSCHADAIVGELTRIQKALGEFLSRFPQDAPYYRVRLDADKKPLAGELERASRETVMVVAAPQEGR